MPENHANFRPLAHRAAIANALPAQFKATKRGEAGPLDYVVVSGS